MTRYIQRHSVLKRWVHNVNLAATIILVASGIFLFVPALAQAVGHDAMQTLRLGHRVIAVIFIAVPLLALAIAPQGLVHFLKSTFAPWDEDDKKFMKLFPKYLFSPKTTHMPKQHEVKSGQRLADGALFFAAVAIAISGVILWAGKAVAPGVLSYALIVHDVSFLMIAVIGLAHGFLGAGIFQPYRGSARLMFGDGRVSESDALYHWGYWAEEELASGKNVVEE